MKTRYSSSIQFIPLLLLRSSLYTVASIYGQCTLLVPELSKKMSSCRDSFSSLTFSKRTARYCFWQRDVWFFVCFYRAVARCPPVSLSHAGILSKRLKFRQTFFHLQVEHHSSFSTPNWIAILRRGPSNGGVECRGMKKSWFSTNISLYLENDTR